ncbi:MAG: alpha/beta hydrolase [Candidatus Coatesbacteria bacterium]
MLPVTTGLRLLAVAVLAYTALMVVVAVFQRRLLYIPSRGYPVTPAAIRLPFEASLLTASDGVRLAAWWIPGMRKDAPVILYFHGNAATLSSLVELAGAFRSAGFAFAAVDYRGYGESGGSPTEAGLYRDAEAAWSWVTGRGAAPGAAPGRVLVWGQSLGAGPASWLASRVPCAGIVLEGAFPSVYASARLHYPAMWLPPFAILDRYPVTAHVAKVACPVLVLHGELDRIAPPAFGGAVFEAAREPKRLVIIPGADHNSITPDLPVVRAALDGFRMVCLKD